MRTIPQCLAVLAMLVSAGSAYADSYQFRIPLPKPGAGSVQPSGGEATPVPGLSFKDQAKIALSAVSFPDTSVGSNSQSVTVTVFNEGTTDVLFDATPFAVAAPFSIGSTTCASQTIKPQAFCTLALVFSPPAAQLYSVDKLTVNSNAVSVTPLPVSGTGVMVGVSKIMSSAQGLSIFVQKSDGTWWAAGSNAYGQLGTGDKVNRTTFTPVPALQGATQVLPSNFYAFAKYADGSWGVAGWAYNGWGATPWSGAANQTRFTKVPALNGARQVVEGNTAVFVQLADGSWSGAGENSYGELGLGNTVQQAALTPIPALAGATQVLSGAYHTFAKLSNGAWAGAGYNDYGQLGTGNTNGRASFTQISELTGATEMVLGGYASFAKFPNGSWSAAGMSGPTGNGTMSRMTFTQVAGLAGATKVSGGDEHTLAGFPDGRWVASGHNAYGQLALGDTSRRGTFTEIPQLARATEVQAGFQYTLAKAANGTWAAVGMNAGQMGLGDTNTRATLTPIQQ